MKFEVKQLRSELVPSLQQPLDLSVKAGETLCISGASGIGKSILLRCLADLVPHTGEMSLNGESSLSMEAHVWRRQVCLLPAESHWWNIVVGDYFGSASDGEGHVACKTELKTEAKTETAVVVAATTETNFSLSCFQELGFPEDVMQWRIDRLSTGEKQRLSLLRVLNNQPQVLLLDEPTASLDPLTIRKAEACIAAYKQQSQCCVIWISHDPAQIRRVADRHIYLDDTGFSAREL